MLPNASLTTRNLTWFCDTKSVDALRINGLKAAYMARYAPEKTKSTVTAILKLTIQRKDTTNIKVKKWVLILAIGIITWPDTRAVSCNISAVPSLELEEICCSYGLFK